MAFCGAQTVQFIVSIVLARILAPEAYGMIAIVLVMTQIFQVFVDSGLGNALMQKKDADDLDFSSVFYFNVVWCLALYALVFAIAPVIANFYENAQLTAVIRVLCLTIVISGLKNVQQAYVSRTMQFKKFFFATLGGTLISAVVGIVLALCGFGVWALVAQKLTNLCIDTSVLWITVEWHPKWIFSFTRLKGLISYGWKLLASSLLDTIYSNLRTLIIGKIYTESDLAYYNQGKQFPDTILGNINAAIDSILLPTMSKAQDDVRQIKEVARKSIRIETYVMAPILLGLTAAAPTIVQVLLSEKWLPCVSFLRVFCMSYLLYPIYTSGVNAIKAVGESGLFLKMNGITKAVGIVVLLMTMWWGIEEIAYGMLFTSLFSQAMNCVLICRLFQYRYLEQMRDTFTAVAMATAMAGIVLLVPLLGFASIVTLMLQLMIGTVTYVLLSMLLNVEGFGYIIAVIHDVTSGKQRK